MKRRIPVLLVTLVVCALVAAPALAVPPARADVPYMTFGPFPFLTCPQGFTVMQEVYQGGTQTVYFDKSGAPVKLIAKITADTTFFSSANTTRRLVASGHFTVRMDLVAGAGKQMGPIIHLVLPGMGTVFLDAGLAVYEGSQVVRLAGIHPLYDPSTLNLERFCAAFD